MTLLDEFYKMGPGLQAAPSARCALPMILHQPNCLRTSSPRTGLKVNLFGFWCHWQGTRHGALHWRLIGKNRPLSILHSSMA